MEEASGLGRAPTGWAVIARTGLGDESEATRLRSGGRRGGGGHNLVGIYSSFSAAGCEDALRSVVVRC